MVILDFKFQAAAAERVFKEEAASLTNVLLEICKGGNGNWFHGEKSFSRGRRVKPAFQCLEGQEYMCF